MIGGKKRIYKKYKRNKRGGQRYWVGAKYIHGPRRKSPKLFSKFRLGPKRKGKRFVFGKLKKTGKWVIQSELTPVNYGAYPRVSPTLDKMEEQLERKKKTANIKEWADIIEEEKRIKELRRKK